MLAISEASYQDATSSLDRLGERGTARAKLNDLVKALLDAETGQRGYLLTERREYLKPYEQAQTDVARAARLAEPTTTPRIRRPRARRWPTSTRESEAKLSELATTIELHDRGVENGWRELLLSDIGREKMEHVRTLGEQLIGYETAQVAIGRRSVYQTLLAEPHRRLGDGSGQPARALHVPAPDGDARPRARRRGPARSPASAIGSSRRSRRAPRS